MRKAAWSLILALSVAGRAFGGERFPRPDFDSGYVRPEMEIPPGPWGGWQGVDLLLLLAGLALAAWMVHGKRWRGGAFLLAVFGVAYFGFFRAGCVCPVGSVQNVALALGGHGYVLPYAILLFFLLPLVFALFFGRVFCTGVCPLGALQEVVLLRPVRVPDVLDRLLRFLPWGVLAVAGLYAYANIGFPVCEHDPFVPLYRLGGGTGTLLLAGAFLLLCVWVGRPYCRYLCPYGALLSLASRLSWKRVSITPDDCITCHLCAEACPYGAIEPPVPPPPPREARGGARIILLLTLVSVPVLAGLGAVVGNRLHAGVVEGVTVVQKAEAVRLEAAGAPLTEMQEHMAEAFLQSHVPASALYARAEGIRSRVAWGMTLLGGLLGAWAGIGLAGLALHRPRTTYQPHPARCVACARCFRACPKGRSALTEKQPTAPPQGAESTAPPAPTFPEHAEGTTA